MLTEPKLTLVINNQTITNQDTATSSPYLSSVAVNPSPRIFSNFNSTEDMPRIAEVGNESPIDRIYPHVFDVNTVSGSVLNLIKEAIDDANNALVSFGEPDLDAVASRLTTIAALMSKAYPLIDFNRSLAGVIAFIRRAALITEPDTIGRSSLNALSTTLSSIHRNPMIDLDDASKFVSTLTKEGWKGELQSVTNLISAFLEDIDIEESQTELFPNNKI